MNNFYNFQTHSHKLHLSSLIYKATKLISSLW